MKTAIMMATAPFLVVTSAIVGGGASYGEGSRVKKGATGMRGSGFLAWPYSWTIIAEKQKRREAQAECFDTALSLCMAMHTALSFQLTSLHFISSVAVSPSPYSVF